jgi:hypothetical protein
VQLQVKRCVGILPGASSIPSRAWKKCAILAIVRADLAFSKNCARRCRFIRVCCHEMVRLPAPQWRMASAYQHLAEHGGAHLIGPVSPFFDAAAVVVRAIAGARRIIAAWWDLVTERGAWRRLVSF